MKVLHKYGNLILLLVKIAILIAVPFLVADSLSYHQLINTKYVKYYDGELYGIDSGSHKDYLFKYDVNKGYGRVVEEEGIKDFTVSEDGRIYLLKTDGGKAELLEWNKKGSVKTIIGVAEVEDMEPQRILAATNGVFYIYYANPGGNEIQKFGYNEDWDPIGSAELYYSEGFDLREAKIADNGAMYFLAEDGSVYYAEEKNEPQLIFDVNNGPEEDRAYTNYRFMPYSISFTNLNSGKYYTVSVSNGDYTPMVINRTYSAAETFDDLQMHNVTYTGDRIKAGSLFTETGKKGVAVCGDVEAVADSIKWTPLQYIITLIAVAAILVGLYFILKKVFAKIEKKMLENDMSILISVTVILMIAGMVVSGIVMISYLKAIQLEEAKACNLEVADEVVEQLSQLDVSALAESGETPIADVYAEYGIGLVFYKVVDGEVFYVSENSNPDVPCVKKDPGMYNSQSEAIKDAVEEGKVAQRFLQIDGINHTAVVVPIGELFGDPSAIVVFMPMMELVQEYLAEIIVVVIINIIILVALFVGIIMVLNTVERQLAGLMDASARVMAGELGAQADDHGINEVAAAIRSFNRMSAKLKREDISVTNCQIMTKAFTPLGLMRQINGGFNETVVNIGSEVKGKAQIFGLMLYGQGLPDTPEEKEASHEIINRFINALSGLGGSIIDVTFHSLRYIDAEMSGNLFRTVAPIIRDINMSGKYRVRAALSVTDIAASIVGTDEYMILDVYETRPKGTRELLQEAESKEISLVVTDFAAKIAGIERCHFRKAGIFHSMPSGSGELLYEALDACKQSDARRRWDTKEIFEAGFLAVYSGRTEEARRAMARVLIEDTEDSVARFYLKAVEGYVKEKDETVD